MIRSGLENIYHLKRLNFRLHLCPHVVQELCEAIQDERHQNITCHELLTFIISTRIITYCRRHNKIKRKKKHYCVVTILDYRYNIQ